MADGSLPVADQDLQLGGAGRFWLTFPAGFFLLAFLLFYPKEGGTQASSGAPPLDPPLITRLSLIVRQDDSGVKFPTLGTMHAIKIPTHSFQHDV